MGLYTAHISFLLVYFIKGQALHLFYSNCLFMKLPKRKLLLLASAIALTGFILFSSLVPLRVDKKISISHSFIKISDILSTTKNIARWYLPFASTDTSTLNTTSLKKVFSGKEYVEIAEQSMIGVSLIAGNEEQKKFFLFTITPDSTNKLQCEVKL
jgi:hypothetical protein